MIQKPKGTYDIFGEKGRQITYIEEAFKKLMEEYNYEYINTPLFENSELFHRGVGETTDIVTKETYDFVDRGNRNMTLRPEGTAGVVRSYIENKMYADPNIPKKLWYYGTMYRYERPQAGRYREFRQFGTEVLGTSSPMIDAEIISIPVNFYKRLGLKGVKVKINSLGDTESRLAYKEKLINYFKPYINNLCEDCKARYEKNPLRILDCKVDADMECMKNAPRILDSLNESSRKHFEDVKMYLEGMNIDFEEDSNIVRGLDYYTHTVFEVEADIEDFGSNKVLCGGGRYEGLAEKIGGVKTSGIGFALGLERLLNALEAEQINLVKNNSIDAYIIPLSDNEKKDAMWLTNLLRKNEFKVDTDYMNRNLKNNFHQADRLNSKYIILIGEEEVKNKILTIKNNSSKTEEKISYDNVIDYLKGRIK